MSQAQRTRLFIVVFSSLLLFTMPIGADDWSRFRGVNGAGVSENRDFFIRTS